jgi:hypothetical protein
MPAAHDWSQLALIQIKRRADDLLQPAKPWK